MPTPAQLEYAGGLFAISAIAGNMFRLCVSSPDRRKPQDAEQTRTFLEAAKRGKNLGE